MGILADFFVAAPEAAAGHQPGLVASGPDSYCVNGIYPMHLETLWAILRDRPWTVETGDAFDQVISDPTGAEWLVRFPDDLVDALADASPAELDKARIEWAATEELNCNPDQLTNLVAALRRLAINARGSGRGIYLWGSL